MSFHDERGVITDLQATFTCSWFSHLSNNFVLIRRKLIHNLPATRWKRMHNQHNIYIPGNEIIPSHRIGTSALHCLKQIKVVDEENGSSETEWRMASIKRCRNVPGSHFFVIRSPRNCSAESEFRVGAWVRQCENMLNLRLLFGASELATTVTESK